jgi:uroporphyrinogen-III synthase
VRRALEGKRIVITRAAHQAGEFELLLRGKGAEPLLYPCIATAPPDETTALDSALHQAAQGDFDWLVLTSANAVLALAQRLETLKISTDSLKNLSVAAVGPATAEATHALLELEMALIPEEYSAEALVYALRPTSGMRVLLPQADLARPTLVEGLVAAGATVTSIVAYRTVQGTGGVDLPALLADGQVDAITFTSPSTAHNFLERLRTEGGNPDQLRGVVLACIGPTTAEAVRDIGLAVAVLPAEHTLNGLVDALERYFERFLEANEAR